jgi:hypothetical protein
VKTPTLRACPAAKSGLLWNTLPVAKTGALSRPPAARCSGALCRATAAVVQCHTCLALGRCVQAPLALHAAQHLRRVASDVAATPAIRHLPVCICVSSSGRLASSRAKWRRAAACTVSTLRASSWLAPTTPPRPSCSHSESKLYTLVRAWLHLRSDGIKTVWCRCNRGEGALMEAPAAAGATLSSAKRVNSIQEQRHIAEARLRPLEKTTTKQPSC